MMETGKLVSSLHLGYSGQINFCVELHYGMPFARISKFKRRQTFGK